MCAAMPFTPTDNGSRSFAGSASGSSDRVNELSQPVCDSNGKAAIEKIIAEFPARISLPSCATPP